LRWHDAREPPFGGKDEDAVLLVELIHVVFEGMGVVRGGRRIKAARRGGREALNVKVLCMPLTVGSSFPAASRSCSPL